MVLIRKIYWRNNSNEEKKKKKIIHNFTRTAIFLVFKTQFKSFYSLIPGIEHWTLSLVFQRFSFVWWMYRFVGSSLCRKKITRHHNPNCYKHILANNTYITYLGYLDTLIELYRIHRMEHSNKFDSTFPHSLPSRTIREP